MTDEAYCAAVSDWYKVQQLWRWRREEAATKAAHASLDEFVKPSSPPSPTSHNKEAGTR
jgi:hypothetical protein